MISPRFSDAMGCEYLKGSVHPGDRKVQRRGKIVGGDGKSQQAQQSRPLRRSKQRQSLAGSDQFLDAIRGRDHGGGPAEVHPSPRRPQECPPSLLRLISSQPSHE